MLKRYAVLGLVLLISGGIGLVRTLPYDPDWVELGLAPHAPMLANRSKTEVPVLWWSTEPPQDLKAELDRMRALSPETLQVQQAARLQADMERLAGGESPAPNLAQVLYGEDWQDKVAAYKAGKERNEFILTVSFVLTLVGLILFAWCVLVFLARCTIWAARRLWGLIAKVIHRPPDETPADAPPAQPQEHDVHPLERGRPGPHKRDRGRTRIAVQGVTPPVEEEPVIYQRSYPDPAQEDGHLNGAEVADEILERLWADEKARPAASLQVGEPDESLAQAAPTPALEAEPSPVAEAEPVRADLEETLAVQNLDLERKLSQVKEMVLSVRSAGDASGPGAAEPFNKTLQQLNEQISAIRQYAAQQQQRVERLQSGYDWNIIRSFCLRVIRCIDNLEDRISRLVQEGEETCHLEEVREELLFALESSGVEQFEPQVGSLFRGQERWAEAIQDKSPCADPDLKGCIMAVLKPGYQYVLDDQNTKVVRTARVKLYGERDCPVPAAQS